MIHYTTVQVPASLPVQRLKEFAASNGCRLLFHSDGGLVLMPVNNPPADYPKENSHAQ